MLFEVQYIATSTLVGATPGQLVFGRDMIPIRQVAGGDLSFFNSFLTVDGWTQVSTVFSMTVIFQSVKNKILVAHSAHAVPNI